MPHEIMPLPPTTTSEERSGNNGVAGHTIAGVGGTHAGEGETTPCGCTPTFFGVKQRSFGTELDLRRAHGVGVTGGSAAWMKVFRTMLLMLWGVRRTGVLAAVPTASAGTTSSNRLSSSKDNGSSTQKGGGLSLTSPLAPLLCDLGDRLGLDAASDSKLMIPCSEVSVPSVDALAALETQRSASRMLQLTCLGADLARRLAPTVGVAGKPAAM